MPSLGGRPTQFGRPQPACKCMNRSATRDGAGARVCFPAPGREILIFGHSGQLMPCFQRLLRERRPHPGAPGPGSKRPSFVLDHHSLESRVPVRGSFLLASSVLFVPSSPPSPLFLPSVQPQDALLKLFVFLRSVPRFCCAPRAVSRLCAASSSERAPRACSHRSPRAMDEC